MVFIQHHERPALVESMGNLSPSLHPRRGVKRKRMWSTSSKLWRPMLSSQTTFLHAKAGCTALTFLLAGPATSPSQKDGARPSKIHAHGRAHACLPLCLYIYGADGSRTQSEGDCSLFTSPPVRAYLR